MPRAGDQGPVRRSRSVIRGGRQRRTGQAQK